MFFLVSVTSATLAFKERLDFDDEDDEQQTHDEPVVVPGYIEETHKNPTHHKTKIPDDTKTTNNGQQLNLSEQGGQQQQQDEWEDYTDSNSKYEQLRLKFARANNDNDNDDEFYDDENNPNNNDDNDERNIDREQPKDKPVWNINQVKQQTETNVEDKTEEPTPVAQPPPSKPVASTGAYRPPQLRGSGGGAASVTVVSGVSQRPTKKEKPNLASTDEFPTLGSTVNKK